MSAIDMYKHECIGMITCPSSFSIVYGNDTQRNIPIYRLDEIADEWQAKAGDLLLGGGAGESAVLRISIPEALHFYTHTNWNSVAACDALHKAYWNMNEAFVFCEGYTKLGWTPAHTIEVWLAAHILSFILREYAGKYSQLCGSVKLASDGTICRPPTPEEKRIW